jgi:hypothetical protein
MGRRDSNMGASLNDEAPEEEWSPPPARPPPAWPRPTPPKLEECPATSPSHHATSSAPAESPRSWSGRRLRIRADLSRQDDADRLVRLPFLGFARWARHDRFSSAVITPDRQDDIHFECRGREHGRALARRSARSGNGPPSRTVSSPEAGSRVRCPRSGMTKRNGGSVAHLVAQTVECRIDRAATVP